MFEHQGSCRGTGRHNVVRFGGELVTWQQYPEQSAQTEAAETVSTAIVPPKDAQVVKTKDKAAEEAAALERAKAEEAENSKNARDDPKICIPRKLT